MRKNLRFTLNKNKKNYEIIFYILYTNIDRCISNIGPFQSFFNNKSFRKRVKLTSSTENIWRAPGEQPLRRRNMLAMLPRPVHRYLDCCRSCSLWRCVKIIIKRTKAARCAFVYARCLHKNHIFILELDIVSKRN